MQDETVDLWATDEVHFQQHGSRCQMWIPPETKDPVLLHAPTRKSVGYFGAVAGWKISVLPGSRQVPWRDLLCVYEKPSPHQHPKRAPSGCHHRQREISSCPVAQGVERRARRRLWSGLSAALQPGVESDRARLETDSAPLLAQPIFLGPGQSY